MHTKSPASCSNFSQQYLVNSRSLSEVTTLWALLHPLLCALQRLLTPVPHPCCSCGHTFVPHPTNSQGMLCPEELCPPGMDCVLQNRVWDSRLLLLLLRFTSSASVTRSQPSWPDQFLWLNPSPGVLLCRRRSSTFNDPFSL